MRDVLFKKSPKCCVPQLPRQFGEGEFEKSPKVVVGG